MRYDPDSRFSGVARRVLGMALVLCAVTGAAGAAPVVGFVEDFTGGTISGWLGGSTVSNPGTGGVGGAADGYLRITQSFLYHLGAHSPTGLPSNEEYVGDWQAAGVTLVKFYLNDVGAQDALEIHFSIGNGNNFWQYNPGFAPPHDQWGVFYADLTSPGNWTQIIGGGIGTFAEALQNVDRIHFRHDHAPFQMAPDDAQGDFGVDRISITSESVDVNPVSWGRIKALYR